MESELDVFSVEQMIFCRFTSIIEDQRTFVFLVGNSQILTLSKNTFIQYHSVEFSIFAVSFIFSHRILHLEKLEETTCFGLAKQKSASYFSFIFSRFVCSFLSIDHRNTKSSWDWILFFFLETSLVLTFVLSDQCKLMPGVMMFEILTYSIGELIAKFCQFLCGYFLSISIDLFSKNSLNFFSLEILFSLSFVLDLSFGQKLQGLDTDFLSILGSITIKNYYHQFLVYQMPTLSY